MAERIFDLYRKAWLRAFYPHYTIDRTTRLFNERFGTSLTREQIRNAANRFKCGPGKDPQRFAPGHVPRNKGRKGHYPPGSEKGWFRKARIPSTPARFTPSAGTARATAIPGRPC